MFALRPLLHRSPRSLPRHALCIRQSSGAVAAAHSSWFQLEDQGMEQPEVLARGSSFLVRGPRTGQTIALVSGHVAAPHRFRQYFPQEWLDHVRDGDCETRLEALAADERPHAIAQSGESGRVGPQKLLLFERQPLLAGFRHARLDVAAFALNERAERAARDAGVRTLALAAPHAAAAAAAGTAVRVAGFRLVARGDGTEGMAWRVVDGHVSERAGMRGFVDTGAAECEMGMCGGPVVLASDEGTCVGLLEGVVPRVDADAAPGDVDEMHRRVQGMAVFVDAQELARFVDELDVLAGSDGTVDAHGATESVRAAAPHKEQPGSRR